MDLHVVCSDCGLDRTCYVKVLPENNISLAVWLFCSSDLSIGETEHYIILPTPALLACLAALNTQTRNCFQRKKKYKENLFLPPE